MNFSHLVFPCRVCFRICLRPVTVRDCWVRANTKIKREETGERRGVRTYNSRDSGNPPQHLNNLCVKNVYAHCPRKFKTESIGKLSNFNCQWTKTFYQNKLNDTRSPSNVLLTIPHSFLRFSRAIDVIYYL